MYTGFQHLHSTMAYIVLALILIVIVIALIGWLQSKPMSSSTKRLARWAMIATHLQFVFGLVIYFLSPMGFSALSGAVMSDAFLRLYTIEHPLMMLLAVIVITIGHGRMKRQFDDSRKNTTIVIFYFIGLLLMLSRIPWAAWP